MNTEILDIPAYIRRCPEEHEKKEIDLEHEARDYALGYADLTTKLTAVRLRNAAAYTEDVSIRKLLHADPVKAIECLTLARRQVRDEAKELTRLIDHVKSTLLPPTSD